MLQAEIDMMSGLISVDEKDYATAYSYFYETFEGYRSMNQLDLAGAAFKFMLFSKPNQIILLSYYNQMLNFVYHAPNRGGVI